MALSSDLVSQFVQITKGEKENKETTVYGTIVESNGGKYVRLDGSDLLTPISLAADAINGERVTVMIKNHTAIVTGNISSPAARTDDVNEIRDTVNRFEIVLADKVSVDRLEAEIARIDTLASDNVVIKGKLEAAEAEIDTLTSHNIVVNEKLTAAEANIDQLEANKIDASVADIKYATIENLDAANAKVNNLEATYGSFHDLTTKRLDANEASIDKLEANKIDASVADIKYATIENLDAANVKVNNLEAEYGIFHDLTTVRLDANEASIDNLEATKLSAESADLKYANIDFSNIDKATMGWFYANSGLIKDVVVGDGTITGNLVGVTISGDLITGNTVIAEKLVIKGEDGLYYKLNTDGMKTELDQTDYNSLNGSIIKAKSITASKINVEDLVAFNATIGGFKIGNNAIYSSLKETIDSNAEGIYLGKDGQIAIGDSSNFLKYYKDEYGKYKLDISAQSLSFGTSGKNVEDAFEEVNSSVDKKFEGMQIGGRNLLLNSNTFSGDNISANQDATIGGTYEGLNVYSYDFSAAESGTEVDILQFKKLYPEKLGAKYTLSFYAKGNGTMVTHFHGSDGYLQCASVVQSNGNTSASGDGRSPWTLSNAWTRYWVTWTLKDSGDISIEKYVLFRLYAGAKVSLCGIQLEKGNKAIDWMPAPEDMASTATNFLSYDDKNGLQVGNKISGSWDGKRTQIKSDSFNILDADGTMLSSFGEKTINLGLNSINTKIRMCQDSLEIRAELLPILNTENEYYTYSILESPNLGLKATERVGMNLQYTKEIDNIPRDFQSTIQCYGKSASMTSSMYTNTGSTSTTKRSALSVAPDGIGIIAQDGVGINTVSDGQVTSRISTSPNRIKLEQCGSGSIDITCSGTDPNTDRIYLNGPTYFLHNENWVYISNGNIKSNGNATIAGALSAGNTTIGGTLSTTGNATIGGTLESGNTTIGGTLSTTGNATIGGTLESGNATVKGTLSTTGNATVKGTLSTTGNATIDGTLESGNATVKGTLSTTGNATIGGNLSANYVTGTWLQGTAANPATEKQDRVCVMDSSGWVYTRTLAQILDDIGISYGTWTAKINGGSITKQICTYMKVGNMCSISFYINGKGGTGTEATNFYISGAPFTPNSSATWYGGGCHVQGLYDTAKYPVTGCIIQSNKRIYIRTAQVGGTGTGYIRVNNGGATFHLSGSITYPTA